MSPSARLVVVVFFALVAAGLAPAAIAPGTLVLEVKQEQKRRVDVNARDARGPTDTDTHHGRLLRIQLRLVGHRGAETEPVTVRWFFIKRDGVTGRFALHAHDFAETTVPRTGTTKLDAEAPVLTVSDYPEQRGLVRQRIRAGDEHQGWVVWASAAGQILAAAASDPALQPWLLANLPKAPKGEAR